MQDYVGSGPWNTFYIVSVPDCGTAKFSGGVGGGYIDYDDGDHFANQQGYYHVSQITGNCNYDFKMDIFHCSIYNLFNTVSEA